MLDTVYERQTLRPVQVFDLIDAFAEARGVLGLAPSPIGTISLFLLSREHAGEVEIYDPPLKMITRINPSGYHLFFGLIENQAKQRIQWLNTLAMGQPNPPGKYQVRLEGQYYQTVDTIFPFEPTDEDSSISAEELRIKQTVTRIELEPNLSYPFPSTARIGSSILRGMVVDKSPSVEEGLAGIEVLAELASPPTDGDGEIFKLKTDASGQWIQRLENDLVEDPMVIHFSQDGNELFRTNPSKFSKDKQNYLYLEKIEVDGNLTFRLKQREL